MEQAPATADGVSSRSAPDPELPDRRAADLGPRLEAVLLLADEPVTESILAAVLEVTEADVRAALAQLVEFYDGTGRGFELRRVGAGWRYYTRDEHAETVARYVLDGQTARLSAAALETLAVVAYSQPVSRGRVSAVRGVNVDGVMRTLVTRGLVEEAGTDPETGAVTFATTSYFLERMGMSSLQELPELAPYLPEATDLEAELSALVRPAADDAGPEDER